MEIKEDALAILEFMSKLTLKLPEKLDEELGDKMDMDELKEDS